MPINDRLKKMAEERLNQIKSKKESISTSIDTFLPGKELTETKISGRTDLFETAKSGVKGLLEPTSSKDLLSMLIPGKGTLDIAQSSVEGADNIRDIVKGTLGGVFQRAEAGVANVADVLQTGDLDRSIPQEFVKGIKGERLGELGDIIRRTDIGKDFNVVGISGSEFLANGLGFFGSVGLTNLATKGKILEGTNKILSSFKKGVGKDIVKGQRKKVGFFKIKADQFKQGIDDAYTSMRQEYQKLYDDIGDNILSGDDAVDLNDIAVRTPTRVISKIKRLEEVSGSKIIVGKTKQIAQHNINTAKSLQKELGRTVRRDVWNGFEPATAEELTMIDDYFKLGDMIANNANQGVSLGKTSINTKFGKLVTNPMTDPKSTLLRLNAKMKKLHDFNKKIRPFVSTRSGVSKTTIRNIRSESNQGMLEEITKFSNRFFKDGKEVIKEIDRFNRVQKIKKGTRVATGIAGGAGVLDVFLIRPILKSLNQGGGGASLPLE